MEFDRRWSTSLTVTVAQWESSRSAVPCTSLSQGTLNENGRKPIQSCALPDKRLMKPYDRLSGGCGIRASRPMAPERYGSSLSVSASIPHGSQSSALCAEWDSGSSSGARPPRARLSRRTSIRDRLTACRGASAPTDLTSYEWHRLRRLRYRRVIAYDRRLARLDFYERDLTLDALEQARWDHKVKDNLIHHSDRGYQYLSILYSERLAGIGIEAPVGSVGYAYYNAMAETINGLFKAEPIWRRGRWRNREAVDHATLEWVH